MHTNNVTCLKSNLFIFITTTLFLFQCSVTLIASKDVDNNVNSHSTLLIDSDNDGIDDAADKDDDNDGITDADESICGIDISALTYYGDAIESMDADSIILMETPGWRTSYANEVFSLPLHLEFKASLGEFKMIGFLPVDSTETVVGWNDGSYKLYIHPSRIFGKLPDVWTFNTLPPNNSLVVMDIDVNGVLTVVSDGIIVYTGSAPLGDYRLAVSTYLGGSIDGVGIRHGNTPCSLIDIDSDGDGVPDRLDLDSDNDMCVDAFEGADDFGIFDMDTEGRLLGAINSNSNSPNYGIPVLAGAGQGIGDSQKEYLIIPDIRHCICLNNINAGDADADQICDDADLCDGFDDLLIGTACNDGDNCTINDIWTTNCDCRGVFYDSDGDNICDVLDACPDFDDDIDIDDDNIPDCIDTCIDKDEDGICDDVDTDVLVNNIDVFTTHRRGFYENAFTQELLSDDPAAVIYYTIDGSVPSSSSTLYTGPFPINSTTILRTIAISGSNSSETETHSFIFLDDIIADPELKTYITEHPQWGQQLKEALRDIPSISVVSDSAINEFNNVSGSMEMLFPDKEDNFQYNCGLGHYGNASLNLPKRNMRMYFDEIYGEKNLKEDVFEGFANGIGAADKFDKLDLRSSHESWLWNSAVPEFEGQTYIATALMDNIMLRGGTPNPHNRFVHVYVDGNYWGQYDLREKFDDNMIAEYLGGDNSDYNFISGSKVTVSAFNPIYGVVKDSINNDWQDFINASSDYATWKTMVNEDSFFDLMILFMWGFAEAEWNATGAPSLGNEFVFQVNDADLFFSRGIPLWTNRTYPQHNANGPGNMFVNLFNEGHPDFLTDFADRVSLLLQFDGELTPQTLRSHMDELADMIDLSIIGEAARWSSESSENPTQWQERLEYFKTNMVDIRSDVVIDQLKHTGLFPVFDPVDFSLANGLVPSNSSLQLTNPNTSGDIYYTLDGTDPRLNGGAINNSATLYQNPIALTEGAYQINARIKGTETTYPEINIGINKPITASRLLGGSLAEVANDGQIWGIYIEELEAAYIANNGATNPWIEIDLGSSQAIDIVRFWERSESANILNATNPYVFISDTPFSSDLASDLVADPNVETFIYPGNAADVFEISVNTQGQYVRVMFDKINSFFCSELEIIQVDINNPVTREVWSSMVAQNYYIDQDYDNLVINEIHYNPYDEVLFNPNTNTTDTVNGRNFEFIELTNIGNDPIHLLGTKFTKGIQFEIDELLVLQPDSFFVFAEDPFWFEQKYGIVPDGRYSGKLDNGGEKINFKDPFDNIIDSLKYNDGGDWPSTADKGFYSLGLKNPTLDNAIGMNWGIQSVFTTPRAENYFTDFGQHTYSGIVINEIHYNPFDGSDSLGNVVSGTEYEFIELKNISAAPIILTDVFFSRGIEYEFPDNTIIPAGDFIVLAEDLVHFQERYGFAAFDAYSGKLSNSGEAIWLSNQETGALLDAVEYDDALPWDFQADGGQVDYSLALIDGQVNNDTRLNWKVQCQSLYTPGADNDFACFNGDDYSGLLINEIHYAPSGGNNFEFIELVNSSFNIIDLEEVILKTSVTHVFEQYFLTPGQYIVIANDSATFHNTYGFAPHAEYVGNLSNNGQSIRLESLFGDLIDVVNYTNTSPWPTDASLGTSSAALTNWTLDNAIGSSWCIQNVAASPKQANSFDDSDNDGIIECRDSCPSLDNSLIGQACDDGDPCTINETFDANCGCSGGVFQDSDNDGICNALDQCAGIDDSLIGQPCDDGDDCTVGEIFNTNCQCTGGTTGDADNDGVCDSLDQCPTMNDALIGQPCDDGIICFTGSTWDSNCNCTGGQYVDTDGDNVCDPLDQCPGFDDHIDTNNNSIPDGCEACQDHIVESTQPFINNNRQASVSIITNGTIPNHQSIEYTAGNSIEMIGLFEVKVGAVFYAHIAPCN